MAMRYPSLLQDSFIRTKRLPRRAQRVTSWIAFLLALVAVVVFPLEAAAQTRGRIASPALQNQPMKSVYFFAGEWRGPAPRGL